MKKIKISKRQKEFVDQMNVEHGVDAFKVYMELGIEKSTPLDYFPNDFVSHIFNGWYEVENTYEVGDYLFNQDNKTYYRIISIENEGVKINPIGNIMCMTVEKSSPKFIKVNEKWKITLLDLGRFSPKLKIGDVVMTHAGDVFVSYSSTEEKIYDLLNNNRIIGFYPIERRVNIS